MKKRGWFLGLGIVLGILVVGMSFANYDYITKKKSAGTALALKDSRNNQLTAQMWDDVIIAIEDIDLRLKALEKGSVLPPPPVPTPVNGICGESAGTCSKGTLEDDNGKTACGTLRTWKCKGSNGGITVSCEKNNPPCSSCGLMGNDKLAKCKTGLPSSLSCSNIDGRGIEYKCSWKCKNEVCNGSYIDCEAANRARVACGSDINCQNSIPQCLNG